MRENLPENTTNKYMYSNDWSSEYCLELNIFINNTQLLQKANIQHLNLDEGYSNEDNAPLEEQKY